MHRSLSKSLLVVAVGLLLLAFSASSLFAGGTTEKKGYTIGLSMHFMRDDYALNCVEAVKAVAAKYPGSNVVATDANANPPKQLADMENLIAQGVDGVRDACRAAGEERIAA